MSYLTKAGMAVLSAGAIGGASYSGYVYFSGDSFAKNLGVSVLNLTGTENSTVWGRRWEELKTTNNGLDSVLTATKRTKWEDLQKWCNDNKDNKFQKDSDSKYQNFETFCTWKVGDKLTDQIPATTGATDSKWIEAHKKLKQKTKDQLVEDLKEIYELPETTPEETKKTKMHGWCTSTYKKTWISDEDKVLTNARDICKST